MISAALAADLHALSVTLDDADVDIGHTFTQLNAAAAAGVGSYLGLCVTVTGRGTAGQLNTMPDHHGEGVGSSVMIPLPTTDNAQLPVVTLVLYARTPGAFTDLAADLAWMTGKDHTQFRLDQDLTPPPAAAPTALALTSLINQAIGVLIGRGRTPEQAAQDLATLAAQGHADLPAAATSVLATADAITTTAPEATPQQ